MRKLLIPLFSLMLFGLTACGESTNEMEVRSNWFKKQELNQENALKVVDNFFEARTFKITGFKLEDGGAIQVRLDVGPAQDHRALLLRTAATSYTFTRMLFSHPDVNSITLEMFGTLEQFDKLPQRFHLVTNSLTRDQANEIHWNKMEEEVTQDHAYDSVLSQFEILQFNPVLDEYIDTRLYRKVYGDAPKG